MKIRIRHPDDPPGSICLLEFRWLKCFWFEMPYYDRQPPWWLGKVERIHDRSGWVMAPKPLHLLFRILPKWRRAKNDSSFRLGEPRWILWQVVAPVWMFGWVAPGYGLARLGRWELQYFPSPKLWLKYIMRSNNMPDGEYPYRRFRVTRW